TAPSDGRDDVVAAHGSRQNPGGRASRPPAGGQNTEIDAVYPPREYPDTRNTVVVLSAAAVKP
ncbi:MAG: hypothetical protein AAF125_20635, partial [Chloroflexota bacterium]